MTVLSSSRRDTLGAPASCRLRGRLPASLYILVAAFVAVGILGCTGDVVAQEVVDAEQAPKGVVIEEIGKGSALEKAGLIPGDVVWAWERLPKTLLNPETAQESPIRGKIESVFDWMWLEVEQAPRGTVTLVGKREGLDRLFEVAMGEWGGKARPRLPDRVLEVYIQGRDKVEAGEIEQGVDLWREMSQFGEAKSDGRLRSWIQLRIGEAYSRTRAWEEALEAYLAALEEAGDPAAEVAIWARIGKIYERRNVFDQAEASYRSALKIAEATLGKSLHAAKIVTNLGILSYYQGKLELALTFFEDALEVAEKLAADSLDQANSLNNLGIVAWARGQLELASAYHGRALKIREKLTPDSLDLAASLNNLGIVAMVRGQLELANAYHQRALEIREKLAPSSLSLAGSLGNLGIVASARGQLELASAYYQRALEIWENKAPGSLDLAANLNNLGIVATVSGRLESASEYHQRALAIRKKLAPDSLDVAVSLVNLGSVAYSRNHLELASEYHQRALYIQEKLAPDSLDLAANLNHLGAVARARGQLELSSEYHQRALEIQEELAPDSLGLATSLNHLGKASRASGNLERAEEFFQRAIHTLEAQISNLGSTQEVKASFRAQHGEYYRDSVETLLQLDRLGDAYATLESSRARAFLALLGERDLIFADVPEDLDRDRRRLAFLYERTQKQIEELDTKEHAEELDQLRSQLRDLRRQYDNNTEEIRRASPRFAAFRYPEPLDLEGVRQTLDPGTVMLSYSVGEEQTHLFVLTREGPLQVHSLAISEETLRDQLARFDRQIMSHDRDGRYTKGRVEMARWLFSRLIEPASETIEKGDRLLVVPDGPLHRLPFAALIRETTSRQAGGQEDSRGWQYLVEWKPVHTVLSGTVYAELRKLRRQPASPGAGEPVPVALAAFGDPEYPQALAVGDAGTVGDVYVRAAAERHTVKPLPYTRVEVETIAGLFGSQPVRTYLGPEASEERAKALGKDVRIVHFAAHGLLDNDFPLNSALALTIPAEVSEGRENGLLQVWEIFERVRLDADLVVLSACRTATGREQFGEGLIGLSRAFQYAGARSVLATLWNVPDRTTAELMSRFYRHLRSGKPKDEALRAVQLELAGGEVRNGNGDVASAPFYWAAFQIIGDWQ